MEVPPGEVESLFLLPEDEHPSVKGAKAYAAAITEFLSAVVERSRAREAEGR